MRHVAPGDTAAVQAAANGVLPLARGLLFRSPVGPPPALLAPARLLDGKEKGVCATGSERGFSLVEALMSLALLALAFVGAARVVHSSVAVLQRAERVAEASRLAASMLTVLLSLPADHPWLDEEAPADRRRVVFSPWRATWSVALAPGWPGLLRVEVEVSGSRSPDVGAVVRLHSLRRDE